jgi:hypothetical protein
MAVKVTLDDIIGSVEPELLNLLKKDFREELDKRVTILDLSYKALKVNVYRSTSTHLEAYNKAYKILVQAVSRIAKRKYSSLEEVPPDLLNKKATFPYFYIDGGDNNRFIVANSFGALDGFVKTLSRDSELSKTSFGTSTVFKQKKDAKGRVLPDEYIRDYRRKIDIGHIPTEDNENLTSPLEEKIASLTLALPKLVFCKLVLVKFPQDDNITIPYIKRWIINYQKLFNIKFDMIVLDYIDCVESHEKTSDPLSNELKVVKSFEAMLADFNIPGWSAIQGNRNSIGAEIVGTNQMGGNIKKAQKTHFLMSIARSDEQKEAGIANIKVLKSRFGRDGILYEDCIFDNDTLDIVIRANRQTFNNTTGSQQDNNTDMIDNDRINRILEY